MEAAKLARYGRNCDDQMNGLADLIKQYEAQSEPMSRVEKVKLWIKWTRDYLPDWHDTNLGNRELEEHFGGNFWTSSFFIFLYK